MSPTVLSKSIITNPKFSVLPQSSPSSCPSLSSKFPSHPQTLAPFTSNSRKRRKTLTLVSSKSSSSSAELSALDEEWLKKLPEKKKPLYSHSLPCIEAWLKKLGFRQSKEDRAVWFTEKPEWHAQLSLDVTDLYIR